VRRVITDRNQARDANAFTNGRRAAASTPLAVPDPDPAADRLMGVVFNLAAEVQVLRDRVF